ncbi:MAG: glycosyl hydrolase family 18 protein, partial [Clostridium sp.]
AKSIIKNSHKNNVKVLIAVGGWEYKGTPLENTFVEATNTDEKTKKLANSILDLVDEYGFDGVDMDWEHPRTDGNSKNQYASLMKYLRKGLDERKKLLTSAVLAGVSAEGNVLWDAAGHTDEALACVDWINIMAYDGGDGDRHSSYDFAVASAQYWRNNRKLPKNKVVLGVPFYGRPSWASYEDILKADSNAHKKDKATIDGKEAHYNGTDTIKKKTKWAMENCSGVMIWEISQDTTIKDKSLLNAIYETITKRN